MSSKIDKLKHELDTLRIEHIKLSQQVDVLRHTNIILVSLLRSSNITLDSNNHYHTIFSTSELKILGELSNLLNSLKHENKTTKENTN